MLRMWTQYGEHREVASNGVAIRIDLPYARPAVVDAVVDAPVVDPGGGEDLPNPGLIRIGLDVLPVPLQVLAAPAPGGSRP